MLYYIHSLGDISELDSARKCCFVRTITWLVAVVAAYDHGDMKMRVLEVTIRY